MTRVTRMTGSGAGTERSRTTGRFTVLLGCLCRRSRRRRLLLLVLLVLLLCLGGLLLLLLLLRLLGFPFPFLLRELPIPILSFSGQLGVRSRFELQIRTAAGVVVASIASTDKYCRLRSVALGVVGFRLGTGPPVHIVHRRRWLRVRIDIQRFDVHGFVGMRVMWRSVVSRRRTVTGMMTGVTRRRPKTYATGSGMGMRP